MILHQHENKLITNNIIALLDLSAPSAFSLMALLVKFATVGDDGVTRLFCRTEVWQTSLRRAELNSWQ